MKKQRNDAVHSKTAMYADSMTIAICVGGRNEILEICVKSRMDGKTIWPEHQTWGLQKLLRTMSTLSYMYPWPHHHNPQRLSYDVIILKHSA